jgi:hypothetical protein
MLRNPENHATSASTTIFWVRLLESSVIHHEVPGQTLMGVQLEMARRLEQRIEIEWLSKAK